MKLPLKTFLSYAHEDEDLKKRLDVHLTALKRSGKIETWNDRSIVPGTEWDDTIIKELNTADVILLLVSADFWPPIISGKSKLRRPWKDTETKRLW